MTVFAKLTRPAVALMLGTATIFATTGFAHAQYPVSTVHVIVPYAPGGTSEILARLIGPKLSDAIGQPVIVENKPSS